MKTPEEISQAIRDEFFRTRYGSSIGRQLTGDALDAAIVGAVSPLCQRIDALETALKELIGLVKGCDPFYAPVDELPRFERVLEDDNENP